MLNGFDTQTRPLSAQELELIPTFVGALSCRVGEQNAVTSDAMISGIQKNMGIKLTGARIRKIVNYIRTKGLLLGLVSSSKGYFIAATSAEVRTYLESLYGRIEAIQAVANALESQSKARFGK